MIAHIIMSATGGGGGEAATPAPSPDTAAVERATHSASPGLYDLSPASTRVTHTYTTAAVALTDAGAGSPARRFISALTHDAGPAPLANGATPLFAPGELTHIARVASAVGTHWQPWQKTLRSSGASRAFHTPRKRVTTAPMSPVDSRVLERAGAAMAVGDDMPVQVHARDDIIATVTAATGSAASCSLDRVSVTAHMLHRVAGVLTHAAPHTMSPSHSPARHRTRSSGAPSLETEKRAARRGEKQVEVHAGATRSSPTSRPALHLSMTSTSPSMRGTSESKAGSPESKSPASPLRSTAPAVLKSPRFMDATQRTASSVQVHMRSPLAGETSARWSKGLRTPTSTGPRGRTAGRTAVESVSDRHTFNFKGEEGRSRGPPSPITLSSASMRISAPPPPPALPSSPPTAMHMTTAAAASSTPAGVTRSPSAGDFVKAHTPDVVANMIAALPRL